MRREAEDFAETELTLVYVARKLKEALRVEEWLTSSGIDYVVETDTFSSGMIFRVKRTGAFFYVMPDREAATRQVLQEGGFSPLHESGRF